MILGFINVKILFVVKKKFPQPKKRRFYINEHIFANQVRLIDQNDDLIGDVSKSEALKISQEAELDLVLLGPNQVPPVAKIMDFGKFLYEQSRKDKKNKAKSKDTEVKEIRLSFNLSEHDRDVKLKHAQKFVSEGHRIKLQLRLKGRENIYAEKAIDILHDFAEKLNSDFEQSPQKQGKVFNVLLKARNNKDNLSKDENQNT